MAKNDAVHLFSALEVAHICGFKNQTMVNWIKKGELKAFMTPGRQYRIYPEDLIAFMEARDMRIPPEILSLCPGKQRVLIIDADETHSAQIKDALSAAFPDFVIFQAFDGLEAGKLLVEEKPSLVILDINLPGFDGQKICKKIKDLLDDSASKILTMAQTGDTKLKNVILENGADAFLMKPLNIEELTGIISAFTQRSGTH
ncbi:MAG: response regulator [Spirochaetales bacterium]|jgi:excisionase family DNA binding protein|nr:response regulator [Spirochaetales bacterium]